MLNYKSTGKGKKQIIFIHGNSQSCESWDSLMKAPELTENYKLIAIDLPGHGKSFRSNDPKKEYSLKSLGDNVNDFIKKECSGDYIVVANSLGTNVIGEVACELINCKGIMLTGSCANGKQLTLENIFKPNPNIAACFIAEPSEEQIDLLIGEATWNLPSSQKEIIKVHIKATDPVFRRCFAEAMGNSAYTDELLNFEKSGIPIAVVFGEEEKICFTDYLDKIPFPKWRNKTHLIPNAGHFLHLDQPDALANLIRKFSVDCFKEKQQKSV